MTLRLLPLCISCALLCCACGGTDGPGVESASEIAVLEQAPTIEGRDGGSSALLWGRSVWVYGDTVLTVDDERGQRWHHNSFSSTTDLVASDGIGGFQEPLDSAGAPLHFVEPTEEEQAFNDAHAGDDCAEEPCGARWATWPGDPVYDAVNDRALVFYGLIYAEPGAFNFHGVGQSIAVWDTFEARPRRPILRPDAQHPTLLFGEGEPGWGIAPMIVDGALYTFACDNDGLDHPCVLARAPREAVFDHDAWRYWDGGDWAKEPGDACELFDGAPIMSVSFNSHLGSYLAVYSPPFSHDIVARTAPGLTGPWSGESVLYTAPEEHAPYDAIHHAEYEEEGGRVQYVTYSRPTEGWFGAEFPIVRIVLH